MNRRYYLLFVPIVLVYVLGMFNDVMEVDAAQYAAMSREMLESGNYVQLYDRGADYLDKPPLLFWVSALSYRAFGVSNFSYRLPSVLFSLLGIFATLQLGKRFYGEKAGFYAALILATCQAWFLMNHDVRTDTILAACTIMAIWQLFIFLDTQKLVHLLVGSVAAAGAMLTKGPIGLMVPALSLCCYLTVKRDWTNLFNWKWVLVPWIVAICISPFLWGLYLQYDLHPGKLIQGVPTQSGVMFYLWTQSFGRITGESVWRDDTTQLFFTHTFLWAFLPWCIVFVIALWKDTRQLIISRFKMVKAEQALTWGGFVLPFIAFSLSNYKLPHYIFVIFPLAAIATGRILHDWIEHRSESIQNTIRWIQLFVSLLILALGVLLCGWSFPMTNILCWSLFAVAAVATFYFALKGKDGLQRLILPSVIAIVALNFLLNIHFYPALFAYASSNQAARALRATGEVGKLNSLIIRPYGLDVYTRRTIPWFKTVRQFMNANRGDSVWVFTNRDGLQEIQKSGLKIIERNELEQFHVSALSVSFLNPETRSREIDHHYLLKVDTRSVPKN